MPPRRSKIRGQAKPCCTPCNTNLPRLRAGNTPLESGVMNYKISVRTLMPPVRSGYGGGIVEGKRRLPSR